MTSPENRRPKVLFFAPILEYPPAGGPQLSAVNAVKVLHRIAELHIITTVPPERLGSPAAEAFFRAHCHTLVHAPTSRWHSRNPFIDKIMRRSRRVLAPVLAWFDVRAILLYAQRENIDIFWIDRVLEHAFAVFRLLRGRRPESPIVGDTEAVYSLFVLRELPMVNNPIRWLLIWLRGKKTQAEERALTARADVVTAVSDVDADFFRQLAPRPQNIMRFSNVVDLADFIERVEPPLPLKKPCALLLGSFGHANSPMDRAARWVAKDIMPRVWEKVPDAHLYIIGRNSQITQAALNGERISVVGQVPSVLPYLQHAAVTLVPLRFESGTRFKIVESGAAAVACVSTTLGAEGLDVTNGEDILIADDTEQFAAAMVSVLSSPEFARQLGDRLHDLVAKDYSLEKQIREGEMILHYIKEKFTDLTIQI